MFSTTYQFEDEDDLVNNCLCKLQDGLKVKPGEATEALRQYGRFRAEMDRLQQRLERPSVGTLSVIQGPWCMYLFRQYIVLEHYRPASKTPFKW